MNESRGGGVQGAGRAAARGAAVPSAGEAISEVFLSPRVVDREAFNDYSSSLRRLIEDASGQAEALRAAGTDAQLAREQLKDIAGKTGPRIDAAIRALTAVEKRADEAQAMVQTARDAARGLELLRAQTEAALADGLSRIEAEAGRRVAAAIERLEEAERRRLALADEHTRAAVEQIETAAAHVSRHLDQQSAAASERARAAGAEAEARLANVKLELDPRLDEARRAAEQRLEALARDIEQRAAQTEENLQNLTARLDERQVVAWTCANEIHRKLEDATARATALMGLRSPLDADADRGAGEAKRPGTVRELLETIHRGRDEASLAIGQLRSVVEQAAQARSQLGEAIVGGAGQIDQLRSMADELRVSVDRSLATADAAQSTLLTRRAELSGLLEGPLAQVHAVTDQIREQIGTVVGQVEQSRRASREAAEAAHGLIERLSALLDRVEPWRGVLLEEAGRDAGVEGLPGPLRAIVQTVRGELAGDVARIALALEQITRKTGTVAQRLHSGELAVGVAAAAPAAGG